MSYFFLALENLSVPFLYHLREFCLGAGFVRSKPADVTAPESEQLLVTLPSGLRITHSLVLNNLLEPGSLDKYLHVLSRSFSHTPHLWTVSHPPLPSTHTQPNPSKRHCTEDAISQLRGHRGTGQSARHFLSLLLGRPFGGKALSSQKQHCLGLRPPGASCPPLESGKMAAALGLPGGHGGCPARGGGGVQKGDLALVKGRRRARLRPVDLNDVLDGPPADGAAGRACLLRCSRGTGTRVHTCR